MPMNLKKLDQNRVSTHTLFDLQPLLLDGPQTLTGLFLLALSFSSPSKFLVLTPKNQNPKLNTIPHSVFCDFWFLLWFPFRDVLD